MFKTSIFQGIGARVGEGLQAAKGSVDRLKQVDFGEAGRRVRQMGVSQVTNLDADKAKGLLVQGGKKAQSLLQTTQQAKEEFARLYGVYKKTGWDEVVQDDAILSALQMIQEQELELVHSQHTKNLKAILAAVQKEIDLLKQKESSSVHRIMDVDNFEGFSQEEAKTIKIVQDSIRMIESGEREEISVGVIKLVAGVMFLPDDFTFRDEYFIHLARGWLLIGNSDRAAQTLVNHVFLEVYNAKDFHRLWSWFCAPQVIDGKEVSLKAITREFVEEFVKLYEQHRRLPIRYQKILFSGLGKK